MIVISTEFGDIKLGFNKKLLKQLNGDRRLWSSGCSLYNYFPRNKAVGHWKEGGWAGEGLFSAKTPATRCANICINIYM